MITSTISRSMVELFFLRKYFPQEMSIEDTRRELRQEELESGEGLRKAQKRFEFLNPIEDEFVTRELDGVKYTFRKGSDGAYLIHSVEFSNPYETWKKHRRYWNK